MGEVDVGGSDGDSYSERLIFYDRLSISRQCVWRVAFCYMFYWNLRVCDVECIFRNFLNFSFDSGSFYILAYIKLECQL